MENKKLNKLKRYTLNGFFVIVFFFGFKYLYNNHKLSEKQLYSSEGIALSGILKQQLIEVYKDKQSLENFPVLTANSGGRNIKSVTSNEKGEIRIEYAESIAKAGYLVLAPKLNDAKELVWQCGESNLDERILPRQCQEDMQVIVKLN